MIEEALQDLGIPVFHDDQHGTAIVLLAALINACRVVDKPLEKLKVVINGGRWGIKRANVGVAELVKSFVSSGFRKT